MRTFIHECDECGDNLVWCVAVGGRNDVRGDSFTYLCGACLDWLSDEIREAEEANQARKDKARADGEEEA